MRFKRLADQAKRVIDQRGGTEALKADAEELRKIAKGEGTLKDKAKAAAAALKDSGEADKPATEGTDPPAAPAAPATEATETPSPPPPSPPPPASA